MERHDVAIVGGGPAGCSAGVFCAREGLDTVVFDRGRSSIQRCAHLENYLGFPDGIDVDTLTALMHDHCETAGCTIVPDLVESVERTDSGFRVLTQEGDDVGARRVVAATRYDGEYLRGLDDDEAMFETYEYGGERTEAFDPDYAAADGTTPVEGLYVATPSDEDVQAIMAAGRGARVARRLVAEVRIADGWWPEVADGVDWARRESELDDDRADREVLRERFDDRYAGDAPVDPDSERYRRVRETYVDAELSSYVSPEEVAARKAEAHETLAAHLDVSAVLEGIGGDALLDAVPDDRILERARAIERTRAEVD